MLIATPPPTLLPSAPPTLAPPLPAPPAHPCTRANRCATVPPAAPASFLLSGARASALGLTGLPKAFRQSDLAACSSRCPSPPRRGLCSHRHAATRAVSEATGQSCSSLAGAACRPLPVP